MAVEGKINITVSAKDKTGGAFKGAMGNITKLGKAAGVAVVAATALATAAVVGIAAKGVTAFVDFEDSMNEVFTLLPGISENAMTKMRNQVLGASEAMGRLPDEIVPALYQSLSAGVPPDNVFEFLDVAHKAALGGVTELTVAVDGITSVVNAYGAETITSTEASDLMFTAVRLGKTTFGELASSLSNVTPISSAMGVEFGDVTAALAAMTSQGTSTSQASTQMRALLQELGDTGTEVGAVFEEIAGVSFLDFVDEGGNVSDALTILEQEAAATNTPIQQMFGNVRAGLGALQLTGSGAEVFSANLLEMADSAGATEAAYDTMNAGMARTFEVIKAKAATAFIRIGESLMPIVELLLEKLVPAFEDAVFYVDTFFYYVSRFITLLSEGQSPVEAFTEIMYGIGDAFGLQNETVESVIEVFTSLYTTVTEDIIPAVLELKDKIIEFATPIVEAILEFVSFKDVLMGLGVVIAAIIVPIIGGLIVTIGQILLPILAVIGIIALLRNAWENDWGGIRTKLTEFWEQTALPIFTIIKEWLEVNIPIAIEALRAFWVDTAWPAIQKAMEVVWAIVEWIFNAYVDYIQNIFIPMVKLLMEFWKDTAWPAIQNAIEIVWPIIEKIFNAIKDFVLDKLIPTIKDLYEKWTTEWWPTIQTVLENVWTVIEEIFTEVGRWINDNLVPWLEFFHQKWTEEIWPAIQAALETAWEIIEPIWEAIREWMEDKIPPILDSLGKKFGEIWEGIKTVISPVKELWDGFVGAVKGFWDWISNKVFSFELNLPNLPDWAIPGSPLPIHTAWKNFAEDMRFMKVDFPVSTPSGSGSRRTIINHNYNTEISANYRNNESEGSLLADIRTLQLLRG